MSRFVAVFVSIFAGLLLLGCATSGLSPREARGHDFATYAMALYETPAFASGAASGARRPLHVPARLAVAQIGEVAPPQAVLDELRKEPGLFSSIQPVPGIPEVAGPTHHSITPADYAAQSRRAAHQHVDRLRAYARDLRADYVFIFGGTIDRANTGTALSAADLTIVGGFFVPSRRIQGIARASGALVDVETGRVVLSVSADSEQKSLAPSFAQENSEIKMLTKLRDEVSLELAEQLTASVKSEAAVGG